MVSTQNIKFKSCGSMCCGWYFKAPTKEKAPCIILAHGFGGVKEMRLDAYGKRFSEAGYHSVVFDYRHFGGSEGEPRQILDIKKQHQDWRAAIKFAKSLPEVDSKRIILWGTSFSGGHVFKVASNQTDIAAVISQVPHMDGVATALALGFWQNIRLITACLKDLVKMGFGLKPYYVDILGTPGDLAAMTAPGEKDAANKLFPPDSSINKKVAARIFLSLAFYSPRKFAKTVMCPILVQVATRDKTTPSMPAINAMKKIPKGELILYDTGHFDLYVAPHFETTIADQLKFLKKHID